MSTSAAVIGSGLGALSAAIRLAHSGIDTHVYEGLGRTGGKAGEIFLEGCRFDTGPSLLTLPQEVKDLFSYCGENLEDHVQLTPMKFVCRYHFADGSFFHAPSGRDAFVSAVRQNFPEDADNAASFLDQCRVLYNLSHQIFLDTPFQEFSRLIKTGKPEHLALIFKLDAHRTMYKALKKKFRSAHLRQLFSRFATYNGSNPYRAPATLNLIAHVEQNLGGWIVCGGIRRLAEAVEKLALRRGVKISTGVRVNKILHNKSSVHGLELSDGSVTANNIVICGADPASAWRNLIKDMPEAAAKYNRLEPSLSGIVFFWSVKAVHPEMDYHNIFFSSNYEKEFDELENKGYSLDPTVYVCITQKENSGDAPAGYENWFVMINTSAIRGGENFEEIISRTRTAVFQRLGKASIDVEKQITAEKVICARDFENLYASNRGGIYGSSSNSIFSAFMRPANRSRELKGLYFAGGGAHPGGGIPLVLKSGRHAADLAMEYLHD